MVWKLLIPIFLPNILAICPWILWFFNTKTLNPNVNSLHSKLQYCNSNSHKFLTPLYLLLFPHSIIIPSYLLYLFPPRALLRVSHLILKPVSDEYIFFLSATKISVVNVKPMWALWNEYLGYLISPKCKRQK